MSIPMPTTHLPDPQYDPAYYDGVLPKRLFAWIIDAALTFAAMLLLSILTVGIAFILWIPVHFALAFFYRWLTIRSHSATFGMRVMNIELRNKRGQKLSNQEAALHTLVFLAGVVFLVMQLISVAMMIARPLNRGLADEVVGTAMINRPA